MRGTESKLASVKLAQGGWKTLPAVQQGKIKAPVETEAFRSDVVLWAHQARLRAAISGFF